MRLPIVRNAAKSNEADLYIYGQIGSDFFGEGITDKSVAQALRELDGVDTINVHIDSPGGDAFQGIAIYNLLTAHSARIVTIVDGWAASAASIIQQAGDERKMAENGMTMIHNAWTLAIGNKSEMRKQGDILEKLDEQLALTYAARSGDRKNVTRYADLMEAESWFTAKEAISNGLADSIIKAKSTSDSKAAQMQEGSVLMRLRFAAHYKHAPNVEESGAAYVPTEREMEQAFRNIGCSKTVAKTLVARMFDNGPGGMPDGRRRDAGDVESEEATAILDALNNVTGKVVKGVFG